MTRNSMHILEASGNYPAWPTPKPTNASFWSSPHARPVSIEAGASRACIYFIEGKEVGMARNVADVLWEMLVNAGVKRCYGIVGDALNPVIDALRRNGNVDFVHVRNEEYGVFAAVADAYFTGVPVVVCGTAGPGVVHLFNGL